MTSKGKFVARDVIRGKTLTEISRLARRKDLVDFARNGGGEGIRDTDASAWHYGGIVGEKAARTIHAFLLRSLPGLTFEEVFAPAKDDTYNPWRIGARCTYELIAKVAKGTIGSWLRAHPSAYCDHVADAAALAGMLHLGVSRYLKVDPAAPDAEKHAAVADVMKLTADGFRAVACRAWEWNRATLMYMTWPDSRRGTAKHHRVGGTLVLPLTPGAGQKFRNGGAEFFDFGVTDYCLESRDLLFVTAAEWGLPGAKDSQWEMSATRTVFTQYAAFCPPLNRDDNFPAVYSYRCSADSSARLKAYHFEEMDVEAPQAGLPLMVCRPPNPQRDSAMVREHKRIVFFLSLLIQESS